MLLRYASFVLCALAMHASLSAAVVFTDDFTYADGDIAANADWFTHSGSANPVNIVGEAAVVSHDSGSRHDVNRPFAEISSGIVSYAFDMTVTGTGPFSGTDTETFAHFGTTTNGGNTVSGFVGRLDVVAPTGSGDYALGLATFSSSLDAVTTADFNLGDLISVLVTYDTDNDVATLTVGGETISGVTGTMSGSVNTFALRQSTSSFDETITIDNLMVSHELSAIPEPSSFAFLGFAVTGIALRRRKRAS